jgi:hypothetical protein
MFNVDHESDGMIQLTNCNRGTSGQMLFGDFDAFLTLHGMIGQLCCDSWEWNRYSTAILHQLLQP